MQRRYIQLCEDYTALGQGCSKTGGRKSFKQMNTVFISCCLWFPFPLIPLSCSFSLTVKQCRECPEGWLHIGNQCYYFSNDRLDWVRSRDSCEEMGSHLTILHTIEQHVCKLMCFVCVCLCVWVCWTLLTSTGVAHSPNCVGYSMLLAKEWMWVEGAMTLIYLCEARLFYLLKLRGPLDFSVITLMMPSFYSSVTVNMVSVAVSWVMHNTRMLQ